MQEKRQDIRTEFSGRVKLIHESFGEKEAKLHDLSNGGLFVLVGEELDLGLEGGSTLKVQSLDIEDAPIIEAEIVRLEPHGIALKFLLD